MKKIKLITFCSIILICCAICLVLIYIVMPKISYYHSVRKVWSDIKKGNEIDDSTVNAYTAPPKWQKFYAIIDSPHPKSLLVEACYYHNEQAVNVLLKNGADPNEFLSNRWSPLEAAIKYKAENDGETVVRITENLLEHGADVNFSSNNYPVAIQAAARLNEADEPNNAFWEQMVLLYLNHAAETKGVLKLSLCSQDVAFCNRLITEYGCDINENTNGMTPLIFAVCRLKESNFKMAQMLLSHGADKTLTDANGKTAYDYAVENGYTELAELLKP